MKANLARMLSPNFKFNILDNTKFSLETFKNNLNSTGDFLQTTKDFFKEKKNKDMLYSDKYTDFLQFQNMLKESVEAEVVPAEDDLMDLPMFNDTSR